MEGGGRGGGVMVWTPAKHERKVLSVAESHSLMGLSFMSNVCFLVSSECSLGCFYQTGLYFSE